MSYRYSEAAKLAGEKWVGSHECVALVQHFAKAPTTLHWKEGARVRGENGLAAGTAIVKQGIMQRCTFPRIAKEYG